MLPKAHQTSHSRMPGSRWVTIMVIWVIETFIFYSFSVYSCHLFLISSASLRSLPFQSFIVPISSVQFSCSVMPLQSHGLQHTRLLCPSPTPGAYSNSCPLSQCCHPAISSSVIPFSSRLQSFQNQGLFQWVSSSHQAAKILEFQLQHQSFQWIFRADFL